MIQSWAKLQLKLLLYGTADVAAMRHRHRKLAAAAKEHLRVFLALFISFKNLSYVLSPPRWQPECAVIPGNYLLE